MEDRGTLAERGLDWVREVAPWPERVEGAALLAELERTLQRHVVLPPGARFGAIVRGQGHQAQVLMPHHDTLIEAEDHVVIFIPHKRLVREVEKLFQVTATFFG